jgi:hypothetical protein
VAHQAGVVPGSRADFQDAIAGLDVKLVEHRRDQPRRRRAGQRPAVLEPVGDHRLPRVVGSGQWGVGHELMTWCVQQGPLDPLSCASPDLRTLATISARSVAGDTVVVSVPIASLLVQRSTMWTAVVSMAR